MRLGWTALVCLLGCGEIREVPVDGSTSAASTGATTTGSSTDASTTSGGGESTTSGPPCPGDCDTQPSPTGMDLVTTTTGVPEERHMVCSHDTAPIVAGDRDGGVATLVVEPGLRVLDVDVMLRVSHEQPQSIRVTLAREGPAIDLMHNAEGERPCGVDLAVRFDDDAEAPASAYCEQTEEPAVVAPVDPLAELLGSDAAGPWTLTAIVPSSASASGTLLDVCLALALADG